MPNEEMKVIVEYLDEWQGSSFHWNANRTTQPYKRTATEQQSVLKECVRYEKMPIYILQNVNSLDQDDPINIKPVKMKSTDMKENRNQSLPVKKPTANDFQILIN